MIPTPGSDPSRPQVAAPAQYDPATAVHDPALPFATAPTSGAYVGPDRRLGSAERRTVLGTSPTGTDRRIGSEDRRAGEESAEKAADAEGSTAAAGTSSAPSPSARGISTATYSGADRRVATVERRKAAASASGRTIVAQAGDTLDSIAERIGGGVTADAIYEVNRSTIDGLAAHFTDPQAQHTLAGVELAVPTVEAAAAGETRPTRTYTVEAGDSLDTIAEAHDVSREELLASNRAALDQQAAARGFVDSGSGARLWPGTEIQVPA